MIAKPQACFGLSSPAASARAATITGSGIPASLGYAYGQAGPQEQRILEELWELRDAPAMPVVEMAALNVRHGPLVLPLGEAASDGMYTRMESD